MKLEEMSAEELVESLVLAHDANSSAEISEEVISRLTRGEKAIKAMESLIALKEKSG